MNDIFSKEYNDELDDIIGKILDENENKLASEEIGDRIHCSNLLVDYLRKMGKSLEEDYSDVVPFTFELLDVDTKIRILEECLEKKISIEKSKIYNFCLEGNVDVQLDLNSERSK